MENKDTVRYYVISDEQIGKITELASRTAIQEYEAARTEERKHWKDRRLRNTKLLLLNYRMLKESAAHSVYLYEPEERDETAGDILEQMMTGTDSDIVVDSIRRSAKRTAIMVTHIETMMEIYRKKCLESDDDVRKRRYHVLYDQYIAEKPNSVKHLARTFHVTTDTIYNDLKIGRFELSTLIFGVDGIRLA